MRTSAILAVLLLVVPFSASAQTASPSVDDLIGALRPGAGGPTRGIRKVVPAAQARVEPPVELASTTMQIQFENGSDRLTPNAMKQLDILGRALASSALASYRFRIEGHTDAVGSRELNNALSARRAATAVDYIATRYGVDRSRLMPEGLGFSQMAFPTADGVAEPRNRRVQIVNLGP